MKTFEFPYKLIFISSHEVTFDFKAMRVDPPRRPHEFHTGVQPICWTK